MLCFAVGASSVESTHSPRTRGAGFGLSDGTTGPGLGLSAATGAGLGLFAANGAGLGLSEGVGVGPGLPAAGAGTGLGLLWVVQVMG